MNMRTVIPCPFYHKLTTFPGPLLASHRHALLFRNCYSNPSHILSFFIHFDEVLPTPRYFCKLHEELWLLDSLSYTPLTSNLNHSISFISHFPLYFNPLLPYFTEQCCSLFRFAIETPGRQAHPSKSCLLLHSSN